MKRQFVGLAILGALLFSPVPALAIPNQAQQMAACGTTIRAFLGLEPWYSCLEAKYGEVRIGALNDLWLVVLVIIEDVIKISGYIAVGFIIWGGIKYIKSQGNASELQQAKDVIKNALLGFVIMLISVAIIEFIVSELTRGLTV